jgi:hypothetical protein
MPVARATLPDVEQMTAVAAPDREVVDLEVVGDHGVVGVAVEDVGVGAALRGVGRVHPGVGLEDAEVGEAAAVADPELDRDQVVEQRRQLLLAAPRDQAEVVARLGALAYLDQRPVIRLRPEPRLEGGRGRIGVGVDVAVGGLVAVAIGSGVDEDVVTARGHHRLELADLLGVGAAGVGGDRRAAGQGGDVEAH